MRHCHNKGRLEPLFDKLIQLIQIIQLLSFRRENVFICKKLVHFMNTLTILVIWSDLCDWPRAWRKHQHLPASRPGGQQQHQIQRERISSMQWLRTLSGIITSFIPWIIEEYEESMLYDKYCVSACSVVAQTVGREDGGGWTLSQLQGPGGGPRGVLVKRNGWRVI